MKKTLRTALPLALCLALGFQAVDAQTRRTATARTPKDPRGTVRFPSDTMGYANDALPAGSVRYGSPEYWAQEQDLRPMPADATQTNAGSTAGTMGVGREPSSPYRSNLNSGSQGTTGTGSMNNNRMDRGTTSPTPMQNQRNTGATQQPSGSVGTGGTLNPQPPAGSQGIGSQPSGNAGAGTGGTGNQGSVGTGQSPIRGTTTPANTQPPATGVSPTGSTPNPPNEMTTPAGTGSNTARPDSNRTGGGR